MRQIMFLKSEKTIFKKFIFVAVFLGCTSTGRVDLCFLWFYVQELPKAQLVVVLVLKRLRRRGNGLKSHPTDWEKPGIEPATPGLQDIGLSPTPRRLLRNYEVLRVLIKYNGITRNNIEENIKFYRVVRVIPKKNYVLIYKNQ